MGTGSVNNKEKSYVINVKPSGTINDGSHNLFWTYVCSTLVKMYRYSKKKKGDFIICQVLYFMRGNMSQLNFH